MVLGQCNRCLVSSPSSPGTAYKSNCNLVHLPPLFSSHPSHNQAMYGHSSSDRDQGARRDEALRPTLPPIRDLFRDELSSSPRRESLLSPSDPRAGLHASSNQLPSLGLRPSTSSSRASISHNYSSNTQLMPPSFQRGRPPVQADERNHGHYQERQPAPQLLHGNQQHFGASHPHHGVQPIGSSHSGMGEYPGAEGAYYHSRHPQMTNPGPSNVIDRSMGGSPAPSSKYGCTYCGKGFNRPSSLKIHLNSHTGEKPFLCTFEGCGRSFSVLSNMRRHARVHTHPSASSVEGSSDDEHSGYH